MHTSFFFFFIKWISFVLERDLHVSSEPCFVFTNKLFYFTLVYSNCRFYCVCKQNVITDQRGAEGLERCQRFGVKAFSFKPEGHHLPFKRPVFSYSQRFQSTIARFTLTVTRKNIHTKDELTHYQITFHSTTIRSSHLIRVVKTKRKFN